MPDPNPLHRAACCGTACGRGTSESGPCVAGTYGAAILRRAQAAGYVLLSAADYDSRIAELLEANNREVERRRTVEAARAILATELKRLRNGCICPPGAEATCQGWQCPRRALPTGSAT